MKKRAKMKAWKGRRSTDMFVVAVYTSREFAEWVGAAGEPVVPVIVREVGRRKGRAK